MTFQYAEEPWNFVIYTVEASVTDVRIQYRELAKRYHPDAGGHHTDFLALQQAYEQVVEYLQTWRWN